MPEAARLGAVAEDRERLAADRLARQRRQYHPVHPGLPRADGVEQPRHDVLGAELLVVAERERLAEGLGGRVVPARLLRRAIDAVGVLRECAVAELSVDLRG